MNVSEDVVIVSERQRKRAASTAISGLRAGYHYFVARWQAYRDHARAMNQLRAFNDRDLRDIGLTRLDIRAIANGTYRRD
jgi:uncharacterized protein YjiS (DUF1127 family)